MVTLYTREELSEALRWHSHSPLVLGLSPHEHVVDLYRLQEWLCGRPVMFVAREFYWTDYRLPGFFGMTQCRFCTWNGLRERTDRQRELRRFRKLNTEGTKAVSRKERRLSAGKLLDTVNEWLYDQMAERIMSRAERVMLLLLSDSRRGMLPSRVISQYRVGGLRKLGMTKHICCLYRGVKVRPELQVGLLSGRVKGKEKV
ncbi:hypothetical protein RDB90_005661 [Salmonella enterica]|nr:hypothetical protein [Salmonella enterica subsp. enterica serovar Oranienburg]EEI9430728.1 hypothetical protein [Salmonella enterica subsp. diarizonae]ELE1937009.1 hypothetical protein [Salmonella enterica]MIP07481.1 hypothetical protein [Salmonella enterica subsp. enterica serovar Oranienburg]